MPATPSEIIGSTRADGWSALPVPRTEHDWIERARAVGGQLRADAAARVRAAATPHAEVRLLKDSGLVTLLGPVAYGGGGQEWPAAYRAVREIAAADGSIGALLGYHYLWSWTARLVGTAEQVAQVEARATERRWMFGGTVDPRDAGVPVRDEGEHLVFNGHKSFSAGSEATDFTLLEGVLDDTDTHVFAIVPTGTPGLNLNGGGGVSIDAVRVDWSAAAGFVNEVFQPRVYNALNVPTIQLVFVSFYLGIARGALDAAAEHTRTRNAAWPEVAEPDVLDTYGDLAAKLWAVEALAEQVADEARVLHRRLAVVTERIRGEHAVRVAAVKARAIDVALEVTSRIVEVTGTRSTVTELGLDRFWRTVHAHTRHDGVSCAGRDIGTFLLRAEIPRPTPYD